MKTKSQFEKETGKIMSQFITTRENVPHIKGGRVAWDRQEQNYIVQMDLRDDSTIQLKAKTSAEAIRLLKDVAKAYEDFKVEFYGE